ncbi:MAG: hypothetical protein HYY16_17775 [Planctomycetes bacterium]|nr:hypothetical protein [Planctomycetota bacterium]
MRRIAALGLAFVLCLGFAAMDGSAVVIIRPDKYVTTLTDAERAELFEWLLQYHSPDFAVRVVEQAIVMDRPDKKDRLKVGITEENPGELLPCVAELLYGNHLLTSGVDTLAGDGSFEGAPFSTGDLSYGSVQHFHGTQSLTKPLHLKIDNTFVQMH